MELPFLGSSLIFMIVYVWSRRYATSPVAIWGKTLTVLWCRQKPLCSHHCCCSTGFRFEGLYLPWALIGFSVLVGNNPIMDILGVVAGHIYYFLLDVLPNTKGWNLIQTPSIL